MARDSKIHPDVHYTVIRLFSIMKSEDIAIYTGISQQSVLRILRYFALHGTMEHKKECKKKGVRLRDMDLEGPWPLKPLWTAPSARHYLPWTIAADCDVTACLAHPLHLLNPTHSM